MKKVGRLPTYAKSVLVSVMHLPNILRHIQTDIESHNTGLESLKQLLEEQQSRLESLETLATGLNDLTETYGRLDSRLTSLQHRFEQTSNSLEKRASGNEIMAKVVNNTVADNHDFDMFYKEFEDRFRGSEDLIRERVSEHLPLFQSLSADVKKKKIIDIGCGRGEFLGVMKEAGLNAIGIDMNGDMVKRARTLGYSAEQADALSFLSAQPTSSLAAITGFHIVEHIPFEALMEIFQQCYRVVAKGGVVLFETPNPESLQVGASTFYTDPSHLRPIPPGLLAFMLEFSGFKTEVVLLHKQHDELESSNKRLVDLYDAVFGYPDYAVVGRKA